jgi:leader peptidase (prepilin peptidase) / N-methyltransferase
VGISFCTLALVAATFVVMATPCAPMAVEWRAGESMQDCPNQCWLSRAVTRHPMVLPSTYRGGSEEENGIAVTAAQAFTVAWIFVFGATIGSFINVVVYRLPRGMRLARPKSHCPLCGNPIRGSDNVPILGWLRLRGRCRSCRAPISARYPLVEFAAGTLFFALLALELLSGGKNLPVRAPNVYAGVVWTLWYTKWDLVAVYLDHAFLLCVVGSAALIADDSVRMPKRLLAAGFFVGLSSPVIDTGLRPVPMWQWDTSIANSMRVLSPALGDVFRVPTLTVALAVLAEGFLGGIVGWALGLLIHEGRRPRAVPGCPDHTVPLLLAMVGIYLGWEAALSTALMVALVSMVVFVGLTRSLPRHCQPRWEWIIFAAATIQVLFWRSFDAIDRWPSSSMSRNTAGLAVAVVAAATLSTRLITSWTDKIAAIDEA